MQKQSDLKITYAQPVIGSPEIDAVVQVLKNPTKIVAGYSVKKFEKRIAKLFGKEYGVMVNSGSSANLIAMEIADIPKGSEVITPILTFSTTLSPILQKELIPVFADVGLGTYVINTDQIESLITNKTKALMIPSLLGNLPDFTKLKKIAKKYGLIFIEDSCDTLGAKFDGKPTGYYSDISTTSFYATHIITTAGNGGMICFHDENLAKRALVMTNWGRNSTLFGVYEKSEDINKRFANILNGQPYDAKFIFSEVGYNFQATEINGAFGLEQLKRLSIFKNQRRKNFAQYMRIFKKFEDVFILPQEDQRTKTVWIGFPVIIRDQAGFDRLKFVKYLEENNIQTRPIFTGNVLLQPAFSNIKTKKTSKDFPNANKIMKDGLLLGCHQSLEKRHIDYLEYTVSRFIKHFSAS